MDFNQSLLPNAQNASVSAWKKSQLKRLACMVSSKERLGYLIEGYLQVAC